METVFHADHTEDRPNVFYNEFLELAVHDLDAPLRKLILLTERLDEKCNSLLLPNELHPYLERISSCAQNMRSLIDDLYTLTNITRQPSDFEVCNLNGLVQVVLQQLKNTLDERKAKVQVLGQLPFVEGNKQLLMMLLKNLLLNAVIFSEENSLPEITISSLETSKAERNELPLKEEIVYYQVDIKDNGIGFNNGDSEKIFDPFVSLHGKSRSHGNGMGLAICHKIISMHEGVVYAEPNEGKGATFTFLIPQTH